MTRFFFTAIHSEQKATSFVMRKRLRPLMAQAGAEDVDEHHSDADDGSSTDDGDEPKKPHQRRYVLSSIPFTTIVIPTKTVIMNSAIRDIENSDLLAEYSHFFVITVNCCLCFHIF